MPFSFVNRRGTPDIFISYSREDGETYLDGLANALTKRGFVCFDDRKGTDAGTVPPETLFRLIKKSRTFVLVATPGAIRKPEYLTREVREFADANGTRRIVAVSFDEGKQLDDWSSAGWEDLVAGKARAREFSECIGTGTPSDKVVNRIDKMSDYLKSIDLQRRDQKRAATVLVGLLVAIAIATVIAYVQIEKAALEQQNAEKAHADAVAAQGEATTQKEIAVQARCDADLALLDADIAQREADRAQTEAATQQRLAREAKQEAEQQQQNALESEKLSRRYDYAANLKRAQYAFEQERLDEGYKLLDRYSAPSAPLTLGKSIGNTEVQQYDVRDFGWLYLSSFYRDEVSSPQKYGLRHCKKDTNGKDDCKRIETLAFSSNGQLLASGSEHGILLTNLRTGKSTELRNFAHGVYHVAFSPDGRWLAYSGAHGEVTLYELASGTYGFLKPFEVWQNPVPLAFTHDSRQLAIAAAATEIELWDVKSKKREETGFALPSGHPTSLSFSGNGELLVAGDQGRLHVWNVASKEYQVVSSVHGLDPNDKITSVSFAPKRKELMTSTKHGDIQFWDLSVWPLDKKKLEIVHPGKYKGRLAQFSPTKAEEFVIAKQTGAIEIWNTKSLTPLNLWKGDGSETTAVAFSPDSSIVAVGQADGQIRLLKSSKASDPFAKSKHNYQQVAFSRDGKWFATSSGSEVTIRNTATMQTVETLKGPANLLTLVFSVDSAFLAATGSGVVVWNTKTWDPHEQLDPSEILSSSDKPKTILSAAFSRDNLSLAVASSAGFGIWKISEPTVTLGREDCLSVDFSSDGKRLAYYCRKGGLVLTSAHNPEQREELNGLRTTNTADHLYTFYVKFSPDSKMLVVGSGAKLKLWDLTKRRQRDPFEGHKRQLTALAFSNDSRLLMSASEDGTMRLWDLITNQELVQIDLGILLNAPRGEGRIYSLAFSRDSQTLAGGGNGVYLWPARVGSHALTAAGTSLIPDERK